MNRSEYLKNPGWKQHRLYYSEIAKEAGINFPPSFILRVQKALKTDKYLNNTPLAKWDNLALSNRAGIAKALQARGDLFSLAGGVCVCKEAVRLAVETLERGPKEWT